MDMQSHSALSKAQGDRGTPAHPQGCRVTRFQWAGQVTRPEVGCDTSQRALAQAFKPTAFVSGTFTSSLPQPSRVQGSTEPATQCRTGAHSRRWNTRALLPSASPLKSPGSAPWQGTHIPVGVLGHPGRPVMPPQPVPIHPDRSLNPLPGETPGSKRVAGGIICLGCWQT